MRSLRPTDIPVFPHICRACVLIRPPGVSFCISALRPRAARLPAGHRRPRHPCKTAQAEAFAPFYGHLFMDICLWTSAAESPHGIRAGSPGREDAAPQPGRKPQGAFPRLPFCPPGEENGCGAPHPTPARFHALPRQKASGAAPEDIRPGYLCGFHFFATYVARQNRLFRIG